MSIFVLFKDKKHKYQVHSAWTFYDLKEELEKKIPIEFDVENSSKSGRYFYRLRPELSELADENNEDSGVEKSINWTLNENVLSLTDCGIKEGTCLRICKHIMFAFILHQENTHDLEISIQIDLHWTFAELKTYFVYNYTQAPFTLNIKEKEDAYLEDFIYKYHAIYMKVLSPDTNPILVQPLREFSGIVSLDSQTKEKGTRDELLVICETYMKNQSQPLNIIVSEPQTLFYNCGGQIISETCIRIYGEIVNHINYNLTDKEVVEKLTHFFTHVGKALEQETVRFSYQSQSYRISSPRCSVASG